jgi:hypothetical protein
MSINWSGLAAQKYAIMEQQARAGMISAQAQQRNAATSASLAPASIADTEAQAALRRMQAEQMPLDSAAQRELQQAQAGLTRANTQLVGEQAITEGMRDNVRAFLGAFDLSRGTNLLDALKSTQPAAPMLGAPEPEPPLVRRGGRLGLAAGTARVPGKGSPKKDTVPAKLAPGEAVLNAAAAENLGRGLIAALNAQGAQQLGLI